jgi:hypothetical protein
MNDLERAVEAIRRTPNPEPDQALFMLIWAIAVDGAPGGPFVVNKEVLNTVHDRLQHLFRSFFGDVSFEVLLRVAGSLPGCPPESAEAVWREEVWQTCVPYVLVRGNMRSATYPVHLMGTKVPADK